MRPVVVPHVDNLSRAFHPLESRFQHGVHGSDKGNYRPVGRFARIDIQDFDAIFADPRAGDRIDNLVDDIRVASFAEIRHAFDDGFHSVGINCSINIEIISRYFTIKGKCRVIVLQNRTFSRLSVLFYNEEKSDSFKYSIWKE